jgi:hypothetical protein
MEQMKVSERNYMRIVLVVFSIGFLTLIFGGCTKVQHVVQPKTLPTKTTESPVATFSPAKVNPMEPWTGTWDVEGAQFVIGQWGMKQNGIIVKSTEDSLYEFKGKVHGNQLKGTIKGDDGINAPFIINLSSDGLTFEGKIPDEYTTHNIRGKKKSVYAIEINPNEPWTGVWHLKYYWGEGHIFVLRQEGRKVKSTNDSCCKFMGRLEGDTLIGSLEFDRDRPILFQLKISRDLLSFSGSLTGAEWGSYFSGIWGKRKK